jgi:hypothetical protein
MEYPEWHVTSAGDGEVDDDYWQSGAGCKQTLSLQAKAPTLHRFNEAAREVADELSHSNQQPTSY